MKPNFDIDRFMDLFTEDRILGIDNEEAEKEDTACPNCGSEMYDDLIRHRGEAIGCTDCK